MDVTEEVMGRADEAIAASLEIVLLRPRVRRRRPRAIAHRAAQQTVAPLAAPRAEGIVMFRSHYALEKMIESPAGRAPEESRAASIAPAAAPARPEPSRPLRWIQVQILAMPAASGRDGPVESTSTASSRAGSTEVSCGHRAWRAGEQTRLR